MFLTGKEVAPPVNMITSPTDVLDVDQVQELLPVGPRQKCPNDLLRNISIPASKSSGDSPRKWPSRRLSGVLIID
jgi:hypothetical protein